MKEITLRVPEETAKLIQKNGLAEIVVRQKYERIKAFEKAKLVNEVASKSSNNLTPEVLKEMKQAKKILKKVGTTKKLESLKDISKIAAQAENLAKSAEVIQALSAISTVVGVANLAVSISTVIVLNNKMDSMQASLNSISNQIQNLEGYNENETSKNCNAIYSRYEMMADDIKNNDEVSLSDMRTLINDTSNEFKNLCGLLDSRSINPAIIQLHISRLLVPYTKLFRKYLADYYSKNNRKPDFYDSLISVYDMLIASCGSEQLKEYWFLEGYSNRQTSDTIDMINTLITTCYVQITDTATLLDKLGSEKYEQLQTALDELMPEDIQNQEDQEKLLKAATA